MATLTPQHLLRVFHQINTHLTFLSSHSRSSIPTYELLHKLNPQITPLDLTVIAYLLPPDDVTFRYVDENDVVTSMKEKVEHSWAHGYRQSQNEVVDDVYEQVATQALEPALRAKQLLIFDFKDVRTHGISLAMVSKKRRRVNPNEERKPSNDFFLSSKELSIQNLTHAQLLAIIIARDKKFKGCLDDYIAEHLSAARAMEVLVATCTPMIPEPETLEDPMEHLRQAPLSQYSGLTAKPTVASMVAALKGKPFYRNQIIHEKMLTTNRGPLFASLEDGIKLESLSRPVQIHPDLKAALIKLKGITMDKLYVHQVEAVQALLDQDTNHVIVSTSTSSGKSLIYQVPVLNQILWDITNNADAVGRKPVRKSTAFFIFPTKALAQDQKRHMQELINYLDTNRKRKIIIDTYDGDTTPKDRPYIRNYADIIFTNLDALHASIMPNHNRVSDSAWTDFLLALKYVVIDEIHVYKGTFGVHVSYVMRRLNRLVRLLQIESPNNPQPIQYVSCSATILKPIEHFRVICGLSGKQHNIIHVAQDGSPHGDKKLVVWNPPPLMNKLGRTEQQKGIAVEEGTPVAVDRFVPRESVIPELARVLIRLLTQFPTIKVILFCPIRKICELVMREIRLILKHGGEGIMKDAPVAVSEHDIMSYRGGYAKDDRRVIEEKMFEGKLRAIVATNALELGIDLAELDVVITCGFPRLKLNLHQQIGRAGRSANSNSLAIYVCGSTPIDEHYKQNPEELHNTDIYEDLCVEGLIDMDLKLLIMEMHLQCAAFEYPIDMMRDMEWFVNSAKAAQSNGFVKACQQKLYRDPDGGPYRTHPSFLPWPADHVSIRAVEETNYAVVDVTNGRNIVIEEVEALRTSFSLYEGAIFLHQGFPYLVKEFNTKDHFAKVERVNVEWITQQRDFTDVDPIEIEYVKCLRPPGPLHAAHSDMPVFYGKIEITTIVFGYFKVNRKAEILEAVDVHNPPMKMFSKGFWLDIPNKAIDLIRNKKLNPAAGIHAAQHALMNILPLYISGGATTNPNARFSSEVGDAELQTECKAPKKEFAQRQSARKRPPRLVFHDCKGGKQGTGVSAKTFEHIDEILYTTYVRVKDCECDWGCPLCVCAGFCKEMMLVMSKPAAQIILGVLIGIDLDTLAELVCDGPEPNLPDIQIETIANTTAVKFSPQVEIIEVQPSRTTHEACLPARDPLPSEIELKSEPKLEVKQESE